MQEVITAKSVGVTANLIVGNWQWMHDQILNRTIGNKILVVGPGEAGKTSIIDFITYGVLEDDRPHEKTIYEKTNKIKHSYKLGRNNSLVLRIKKTTDLPGQSGPESHANLVGKYKPDILIVVLDSSLKMEHEDLSGWMNLFTERLNDLLIEKPKLKKKHLEIFVALNKRDKVKRSIDYDARKRRVKKIFEENLTIKGKQYSNNIPIVSTIAVQTDNGTKSLDSLIQKIARRIAK